MICEGTQQHTEIQPLVSIVVPVYNGGELLERCLMHIISQHYPREKLQLIVVDNGSKDSSAQIAARYADEVVRYSGSQSSYAARNEGIRRARGEIVAFTDADCFADPEWLGVLVKPFATPDVVGVAGPTLLVPSGGLLTRVQVAQHQEAAATLRQRQTVVPTSNCAYRAQLFATIGMFRADLQSGGDWEFSLRVMQSQLGQLVFHAGARVHTQPRKTLSSLWRQSRRYGWGAADRWHQTQRGPAPQRLFIQCALDCLASAYQGTRRLVAPSHADLAHRCVPWLNLFQRSAYLLGLSSYYLSRLRVLRWLRYDPAKEYYSKV